MTTIRAPERKGNARDICKREVDFLLDLVTHNIGINIPWETVVDSLNLVHKTLDGKHPSIETIPGSQQERELRESREASVKWRERFEKMEQEMRELRSDMNREREAANQWCERATKAESDFKKLHGEFMNAQSTISRLQNNRERTQLQEYKRAIQLVRPIIEAMCDHFVADPPLPCWGDEGADPKAFAADGIAYGEKIGIGEIRFGHLEVASGCLHQSIFIDHPQVDEDADEDVSDEIQEVSDG